MTLDVNPVYEMSLDTTCYVPATSPVTPPFSEDLLHPPGPESLPLGGPVSLDSRFAYDITLLDRDTDLSLLAVPLLHLPDNFCDAFCAPSDTGDHLLISDRLPSCPYRMTSYARADIADVDPVYGLQLNHPRFLEYIGAPESARLLTQAPGHWVRTMDRRMLSWRLYSSSMMPAS